MEEGNDTTPPSYLRQPSGGESGPVGGGVFRNAPAGAPQWSLFLISAYVSLCLRAIVCHRLSRFSRLFMRDPHSRDPVANVGERARVRRLPPLVSSDFFFAFLAPQTNGARLT